LYIGVGEETVDGVGGEAVDGVGGDDTTTTTTTTYRWTRIGVLDAVVGE